MTVSALSAFALTVIGMTTFGSNGATVLRTDTSIAICYTLGFERHCVRSFVLLLREQINKEKSA